MSNLNHSDTDKFLNKKTKNNFYVVLLTFVILGVFFKIIPLSYDDNNNFKNLPQNSTTSCYTNTNPNINSNVNPNKEYSEKSSYIRNFKSINTNNTSNLLFNNYKSLNNNVKSVSEVKPKVEVVYITKTGKCYHNSYCSCLKKSKIGINKTLAIQQNYRACSKCH